MSKSSNSVHNNKRRHSVPSAAAGSSAQMMGWTHHPPNPQMFYQWAPPSQGPSSSQAGGMFVVPNSKPWELSSGSEDSDFESSKKKKKVKALPKTEPSLGKKRPGRPSKQETEKREFVKKLPGYVQGDDVIAYKEKGACRGCQIYKGRVALKECGHAAFCFSCINKLRDDAEKLCQFSKCPVDDCYKLAKDWIVLFNVSG